MTTAHRPTYVSTKGGSIQGGNKLYYPSLLYSSKDLPSNLKIKTRQFGQGTIPENRRKDFKRELLEREKRAASGLGLVSQIYADVDDYSSLIDNNSISISRVDITSDLLQLEAPKKKQRLDSISGISEIKSQVASNQADKVFLQDKDLEFHDDYEEERHVDKSASNSDEEEISDKLNKAESSEVSSEEEEEDEEELLYREYEKIQKMRKEENERKEAESLKLQTRDQILMGNPILNTTGYSLKKKWFEDTVFKNQSRNEPKVKKRFINDTVRSDFHRKFLSKTIQ